MTIISPNDFAPAGSPAPVTSKRSFHSNFFFRQMDLLLMVLVPLVLALLSWMLFDGRNRVEVRPEPVRVARNVRRHGRR
jgi:hypothetical protein